MTYGHQIVILDRGWVFAGDVTVEGDFCIIAQARNVRRWGTTKGLGELAASGPSQKTVLDPAGTVRAPMRAVIAMLAYEADKWIAR